jgi:uncharacterized membrane protein YfcA
MLALVFGSAGMFISYLSANVSRHISPELLLVAFAVLMIGIGTGAWMSSRLEVER